MTSPPPGAPDYFALFQSMFTPPASPAAATQLPPMFAMLDPKELERKIGELETVLAWLKGTTGMIELSLQTMRYQQSLLSSIAEHKSAPPPASQVPNMDELAKMAGSMNPALWAFNMMQQPESPKTAKGSADPAPSAKAKKQRR